MDRTLAARRSVGVGKKLSPTGPRHWDYGVLPDAPGQSIYSVTPPTKAQAVPTQLTPLPAASAPAAGANKGSGGGK